MLRLFEVTKIILLLILLLIMQVSMALSFGDSQPSSSPTGPSPADSSSTIQSSPNIVLQPSADTIAQLNKLFEAKANYKFFKNYPKLELFKIPERSQ